MKKGMKKDLVKGSLSMKKMNRTMEDSKDILQPIPEDVEAELNKILDVEDID
jgi:hypothetical protein